MCRPLSLLCCSFLFRIVQVAVAVAVAVTSVCLSVCRWLISFSLFSSFRAVVSSCLVSARATTTATTSPFGRFVYGSRASRCSPSSRCRLFRLLPSFSFLLFFLLLRSRLMTKEPTQPVSLHHLLPTSQSASQPVSQSSSSSSSSLFFIYTEKPAAGLL